MLVTWYKDKYPSHTIHELTKRCCDEFDKLEYHVNWQPSGLYLEVPGSISGDLADLGVSWKRLGKLEFCPFCGEAIIFEHKEIIDGPTTAIGGENE